MPEQPSPPVSPRLPAAIPNITAGAAEPHSLVGRSVAVATGAVRVPAGAVAVAAHAEVVAPTAEVIAAVSAVGVPGGWTVPETRVGDPDNREVADDLLGLLAATGAGHELEDVGHGHAAFRARAAGRASVFIKSHAEMVDGGPWTVNATRQRSPARRTKLVNGRVADALDGAVGAGEGRDIEDDEVMALAFEEAGHQGARRELVAEMDEAEVLRL